jgi:hypothetical protein
MTTTKPLTTQYADIRNAAKMLAGDYVPEGLDPLDALRELQALQQIIEKAQAALAPAVAAARNDGATWQDVASALGVTRQSAHERFA